METTVLRYVCWLGGRLVPMSGFFLKLRDRNTAVELLH